MRKKIKNIALMVSIIMFGLVGFSTAVYGRFTRQYNPEVSSFGITISSQENMMVSATGAQGTFAFKDKLKLSELETNMPIALTPLIGKVTPTEDGTYQVLSLSRSNPGTIDRYYLTFDLYFIGSSDMNLYYAGSTSGVAAIQQASSADYHFTPGDEQRLANNLRIAFSTYATTYQPSGTGTTVIYSAQPILTNVYANTAIEGENYKTFNKLGYSNTAEDTILATTTKNEVTKVKVTIWLEEDGLGDLEAICDLAVSIRFQAVPVANS